MHPQTQSNHLSLILLAFLTDFTNALPQTIQTRPAVVVDRDPSAVSSSMKWAQDNLFYTVGGIGAFYSMFELFGYIPNVPAVIGVIMFFIVKCWKKKKGNGTTKKTTAVDREPSAEEKAENEFRKTQDNVFVKMMTFLGSSHGRRSQV
jgi:hypothetical protein